MAKPRIAVLGLGTMGAAIARRLLESGYPLTVYNRSAAKALPLADLGAIMAPTPAAAVAEAGVAVLSLADGPAVEQVLFGDGGVVAAERDGLSVVDTSTVAPAQARDFGARLARHGLRRVEACVVGNAELARQGQLRVMAAGAGPDVAAVRPVLDAVGAEVRVVGPTGNAAAMKLVFNALLGGQLAALADALDYGVAAGLDRKTLLGAIAASGFASKAMAYRCGLALRGDLDPAAFRTELMRKDLGLVLSEAAELKTGVPVIVSAEGRFAEVCHTGLGGLDAAVLLTDPDQAGRPGAPAHGAGAAR